MRSNKSDHSSPKPRTAGSWTRRWLVMFVLAQAGILVAQELKLPENYRPMPREKGGRFFGNLASAARAIHLDEARTEFELDGKGIAVAIIGSGISESEELPQISKVPGFDQSDEYRLGTFLAGIIGGRGFERGIAPGVELVSMNIVGRDGSWKPERLIDALHELNNRGSETPIRAVLLALTDGGHYRNLAEATEKYGDRVDQLRREIDQLGKNKVVVIAAAGDRQLEAKSLGLSFPAIVPNIVVCPAVAVLSSEESAEIGERTVHWSVRAGQLLPSSQRPQPIRPSNENKSRIRSWTIAAPGSVEFSTGNKNSPQLRLRSSSMQAAAIVAAAVALEQQYHMRLAGQFAPVASIIEWMQSGSAEASGSPDSLKNAPLAEKDLEGRYAQLDLLQTLQVMRTRLSPQQLKGTPPDPKPRRVEGRQFGDLSEVADGIGLKEAVNRFKSAPNMKTETNELTGNGTCVAILATGIVKDHPDFENRVIERIDFTGSTPDDENGYGTFVAGVIAAGRKKQSLGNRGVAPGAKIVSVKVLDANGGGQMETIVKGLEWVLANRERLEISTVVIALGTGQYLTLDQAPADHEVATMRPLVQKLRENRVVVIAPAGNVKGDAKPIGMSFPAIIPEVFSVGAMEFERAAETEQSFEESKFQQQSQIATPRQGNQIPARLTAYSLRLPKDTDLVAPGGPVVSSSRDPGRGQALSGTSTATALTAGTVLLVQDYYLSGHHELPPAKFVEDSITEGAWYIEDEVSGAEFRRLDVLGAIRRCYTQSIGQQKSR